MSRRDRTAKPPVAGAAPVGGVASTTDSLPRETEQGKARDTLGDSGKERHTGTLSVPSQSVVRGGRRTTHALDGGDGRAASPPTARGSADRRSPRRHARGGAARSRLLDSWVGFLSPHFADNGSCYFTGTYSDEYGYANGLMLTRNVQRDFSRFLEQTGFSDREWCCAVEPHLDRDIKHLHAIVQGNFTDSDRLYLKLMWQVHRGWSKSLPVTDGCESYVTKYALKSTVEAFDFAFHREAQS